VAFIFTRETHSIEHLKKAGIEGEHVGFAPDATFFLNIHDDKKAENLFRSGKQNKSLYLLINRQIKNEKF